MSVTGSFRTGLVSDLNAIDGTGSFGLNLAEVSSEPVLAHEIATPGVALMSGEGEDDPATMSVATGRCTQDYGLTLYVKSATPNADLDTGLDDVRLAVGRSTSNIRGVAGVIWAGVVSWENVEQEKRHSGVIHRRDMTVRIAYIYTRDSI